jgi:hypothetical protein
MSRLQYSHRLNQQKGFIVFSALSVFSILLVTGVIWLVIDIHQQSRLQLIADNAAMSGAAAISTKLKRPSKLCTIVKRTIALSLKGPFQANCQLFSTRPPYQARSQPSILRTLSAQNHQVSAIATSIRCGNKFSCKGQSYAILAK